MSQSGVLQIGVYLLDDRVLTMGGISGHGVQVGGVGGGEEGVETPHVE